MKSTWFGDKKRYDFARCLQEADRGMHTWDLLRTWLECALAAVRQPIKKLLTGSIDEAIEQRYMQNVKRVKYPAKFADCLGILTLALEEKQDDFIGQTLSELELNDSKWKGQCFTPSCVCELMAQMQLADLKRDGRQDGRCYQDDPLMIAEPACGGGAMVIAASKHLRSMGFEADEFYWVANDVDWRMFATCYIQCTLLDIPGTIMHANTLSLEEWDSEVTFSGLNQLVERRERQRLRRMVDKIKGIFSSDHSRGVAVVEEELPLPIPKVEQAEVTVTKRTRQLELF